MAEAEFEHKNSCLPYTHSEEVSDSELPGFIADSICSLLDCLAVVGELAQTGQRDRGPHFKTYSLGDSS